MSKRGSPYLRKRAEGKDHLAVMGHVCHKILAIIFAVLRDNKPYVTASASWLFIAGLCRYITCSVLSFTIESIFLAPHSRWPEFHHKQSCSVNPRLKKSGGFIHDKNNSASSIGNHVCNNADAQRAKLCDVWHDDNLRDGSFAETRGTAELLAKPLWFRASRRRARPQSCPSRAVSIPPQLLTTLDATDGAKLVAKFHSLQSRRFSSSTRKNRGVK